MFTKVSEQGNVIEVTRLLRKNSVANILKISADEYIRLSDDTGEIYQFEHLDNRAGDKKSLYRSFRNIRAIINTNCTDPAALRWITLTYAENMQDTKRLYTDFRDFWKRFKRRYPEAEYITVAEPQERGAWHMHALFVFPGRAPFIPNSELREIWGHGFVRVTDVTNVDNVGAYLSAYIADVEVPLDSKEGTIKVMPDGTRKRFVKGGRLKLYPPGMNLYRCSRGIKKPVERWATSAEVADLVGDAKMTYSNSIEFEGEDGFFQKVEKEYYNRARR